MANLVEEKVRIIGPLAKRALLRMSCVCLVAVCLAQAGRGQQRPVPVAYGYITAIDGPNEFDVNGQKVVTTDATAYGTTKGKAVTGPGRWRNSMQVGAHVLVMGHHNGRHKPATADIVRVRDDRDMRLAGMAVIERVIVRGAEPVFEADGYKIRIVPETEIYYTGTLKTLDAVEPNTWLRYEGKRGSDGVVVASRARFFPPSAMKIKKRKHPDEIRQSLRPPQFEPGSQKDASNASLPGNPAGAVQDGSISLGVLGHLHAIPADRTLQERVQRIGMRLVPEYQKQLADSDPTKIKFEFYVVEDPKTQYEICLDDGLILMPENALKRLQNDDELAAVLADGIAYNMQRQAGRIAMDNGLMLGAEAAGLVAGAFVPGLGLVTDLGTAVAGKNINDPLVQERARLALALMANAGFDSRQAPQTWRLLAPKNLPKKLKSLHYPDYATYQLSILRLQYGEQRGEAAHAEAGHK